MQPRQLLWWIVPLAVAAIWAFSMLGPERQPGIAPGLGVQPPEPAPAAAPGEPPAPARAQPGPAAAKVAAPAPAAPAPAAAPEAEAAPAEAARAVQQPATEARIRPSELFAAAFLEEERDPQWAGQAEQNVRDAYQQAQVPASAILAVQCRSTLCKIDLLFDRTQQLAFLAAQNNLRQHFSNDVAVDRQSAPSAVKPERMTAYIPRKGHTLKDYEGYLQ